MPRFPRLSPTGRRVRAPTTDLIELENEDGKSFIALAFRAAYRDAPVLDKGIATVREFLDMPMVPGLAEIKIHAEATGVFGYPGGDGRTIW